MLRIKTIVCLFLIAAFCRFSTSYAADKNILSEDNMLIVEIFVDRGSTGENIEIYQHEGGYLLPLRFLTNLVDFAIEVDGHKAGGWFIAENRRFKLDIDKGEVIVGGKRMKMPGRPVVAGYDDIYVDSSLFSEWFPIDVELNYSDLILRLKPREKLPIQVRLEREKLRARMQKLTGEKKDFELVENPYKAYDYPFTDIELGYNYGSDQDPSNQTTYSILSQGDLGYLTTQIAMTGESEDSISGLRVNAGRSDNTGNLLGAMHAKSFLAGDINSVSVPLAASRSLGRGFTVSNVDLKRADQFDSTSFIGDAIPGWEVEIYRNGVLLDYQLVGDDGRYDFGDVPIFFGNNVFRIVSYGPQGQVRERTETMLIDDSILHKGEFNYQFSADEKSQTIFGQDEDRQNILHEKEARLVASGSYGITDRMTAVFSGVRTPLEDGKTHNYQTFGLQNNFSAMLTSLNFAYDSEEKGWAAQFLMHTRIKDVSIRAEQSIFNDFVSEVESALLQKPESRSQLDMDGRIAGLFQSGLAYRFTGELEKFEGNRDITTLSNRLSTTLYGIGLSHNIQFTETKDDTISLTRTNGDFAVRGRYKNFILRLSTDYEIEPETAFRSLNLNVQKQIDNNNNVIFGVRQDLNGEDLTSFDVSLNNKFDKFILSTTLRADNDDNYAMGVRLSFSFGHEPRTEKWRMEGNDIASEGAVSLQAFLDNNYNHVYDDGDEILPDVTFRAGYRRQEGKDTDPVVITRLEPYVKNNVELDTASLENPFWMPEKEGYSVIPRPGNITKVDFPILNTTEIDGTVYLQKSGSSRAVPRVELELVNSKGKVVATAKSEFDGFYLFEKVVPDTYRIRVSEDSLTRLKATNNPAETVTIEPDSDVVSGIDITVKGGR